MAPVRILSFTALVALALLAGLLVVQNSTLRNEAAVLRSENALATAAAQTAHIALQQRTVLAEGLINELSRQLREQKNLARLQVVALGPRAEATPAAQAIVVWDQSQQTGLLSSENLPPISAASDYQLWIRSPDHEQPVNGGVVHVASSGPIALGFKPEQPVSRASAFAVSLEKKGGSPVPTGPIVLSTK